MILIVCQFILRKLHAGGSRMIKSQVWEMGGNVQSSAYLLVARVLRVRTRGDLGRRSRRHVVRSRHSPVNWGTKENKFIQMWPFLQTVKNKLCNLIGYLHTWSRHKQVDWRCRVGHAHRGKEVRGGGRGTRGSRPILLQNVHVVLPHVYKKHIKRGNHFKQKTHFCLVCSRNLLKAVAQH